MEQNYESIFPDRPVIYAGFWQRVGAYLLDAMILAVVQFVVGRLLTSMPIVNMCINIVFGWLYFALQESGPRQATPGKRAVGMVVTDLHGGRITFRQATGRYFGKILSAAIIFIGYLMMTWDEKKQTLHDKMANTLVVMA